MGLDGRVQMKLSLLSQLSTTAAAPQACGTMTLFTPGVGILSPYHLQDYYESVRRAQEEAKAEEARKLAEKEAKKVKDLRVY